MVTITDTLTGLATPTTSDQLTTYGHIKNKLRYLAFGRINNSAMAGGGQVAWRAISSGFTHPFPNDSTQDGEIPRGGFIRNVRASLANAPPSGSFVLELQGGTPTITLTWASGESGVKKDTTTVATTTNGARLKFKLTDNSSGFTPNLAVLFEVFGI